jgi:hypothetical protein
MLDVDPVGRGDNGLDMRDRAEAALKRGQRNRLNRPDSNAIMGNEYRAVAE